MFISQYDKGQKRVVAFFFFMSLSFWGTAQESQKYFFPINPGKTNYLAGAVGEVRSGHFHAGLDVKTGGRNGLPVYAAADGYMVRVRVSGRGYGRVLYLKHKDGKVSVYAHLSKFTDLLEDFALQQQYKKGWYEFDVFPSSQDFVVKKGDIIGYSGNTGSSGGPHLHFEIRNKEEEPMDILAWESRELKDTKPPVLYDLLVEPLDKKAMRSGMMAPMSTTFKGDGKGGYLLSDTIRGIGQFGLAYNGYDKTNVVSNRYGINYCKVYVDDQLYFQYDVQKVSFYETKQVDVFVNFGIWKNNYKKFKRLFIAEGNGLSFYENSPSNGVISLKEGEVKQVRIHFTDSKGNTAIARAIMKGEQPIDNTLWKKYKSNNDLGVQNGYWWHQSDEAHEMKLFLEDGKSHTLKPDLIENKYWNHWDLTKGIPTYYTINKRTTYLPVIQLLIADGDNYYYSTEAEVFFEKGALYDSLYFAAWNEGQYLILGSTDVPLKKKIRVVMKPTQKMVEKEFASVYAIGSRGQQSFIGGEWIGSHIEFLTKSFGKYTLLEDKRPPTVNYLGVKDGEVRYWIQDKRSGLAGFSAHLNGDVLILEYDYRYNTLVSKKNKGMILKGELVLKAWDNQGNESVKKVIIP